MFGFVSHEIARCLVSLCIELVNVLFNILNIIHCVGNKTSLLPQSIWQLPNKTYRSFAKSFPFLRYSYIPNAV